jgi:hypothetical protein
MTVTFPSSGTTVNWNIFGDSGSAPQGTSCGTASNGYEQFWVFRDAGEYLYPVDDWDCNSIYWVF